MKEIDPEFDHSNIGEFNSGKESKQAFWDASFLQTF